MKKTEKLSAYGAPVGVLKIPMLLEFIPPVGGLKGNSNMPVSDLELVRVLEINAEEGTQAEKAARMGVKPAHFKNLVALAIAKEVDADAAKLSEVDKLKIALAKANRDLRAAQKDSDSAEKIREEIFRLASRSPEPPAWLTEGESAPGHPGVPMGLWSDWHFGEVVDPVEVGGFNRFNSEIAAIRITKLVDRTVDLCRNHMGSGEKQYPGIVICLGGDMITGDIHEELLVTNDRTTQQSIVELTDLLAAALERCADEFGRVFVPCVVGNHGRSTRKPRMKGRVYTSHEWNIYCNLERYFRRDDRVRFFIPGESDAYFKVFGHRFLLTHGDSLGVKGGDGIIGAIGPIMRGSLKVGRSEAQIGRDVDTLLMGHWHQMLWLPGAIVNGALKGYDEYARLALRAPFARPSQALWFVHPKHGITAKWEVFLDEAPAAKAKEWISWAA